MIPLRAIGSELGSSHSNLKENKSISSTQSIVGQHHRRRLAMSRGIRRVVGEPVPTRRNLIRIETWEQVISFFCFFFSRNDRIVDRRNPGGRLLFFFVFLTTDKKSKKKKEYVERAFARRDGEGLLWAARAKGDRRWRAEEARNRGLVLSVLIGCHRRTSGSTRAHPRANRFFRLPIRSRNYSLFSLGLSLFFFFFSVSLSFFLSFFLSGPFTICLRARPTYRARTNS